jgi:predicted Rossmann fold flavoprotein
MISWDVAVVGAGAAGLLAGTRAAECGRRTLLLEKNARPGVKILMSGGTRCNLTHDTDAAGIVGAFGPSGRFLHSALAALGPRQLVELIEAEGVATKVEATGKIFPVSNKATDVLAALLRRLERSGCQLALEEPLIELEPAAEGFLLITSGRVLTAGKVILTSGGKSYPGSGTTGDGYRLAAKLGHTIVPPRPALAPVTVDAPWVRALKGITVPDVAVRVLESGPADAPRSGKTSVLATRRGSFLFTHWGLSGPVVLDVSRVISGHPQPRQLAIECDFLPAIKDADLDALLRESAAAAGKRQLVSMLPEALPRRLSEALLTLAQLDGQQKSAELSKVGRARLVQAIKRTLLAVTGTLGFEKAEVTAGGIALSEVDSRTMQSKLVPGLYLAGEVLDLDGPIGGYNFQAAFSTGWLAGQSAAATLA